MASLAEELILLALDDDKGTIATSAQIPVRYGLPAAGMVDLALAGRISVDAGTKVSVLEDSPTGDEILDEMLAQIGQSNKQRKIGDWVSRFGNGKIKKLAERLEVRLVDRGVLRQVEGRHLGLFPWRRYPTVDGSPEAEIRQRLERVLLGGDEPDARTASLVSLAASCKLLHAVFPKQHHKQVDARAKQIAENEVAGQAVSRAVAEVTAAIAASIAAVSAASASSSR